MYYEFHILLKEAVVAFVPVFVCNGYQTARVTSVFVDLPWILVTADNAVEQATLPP
jgi:hypothetical protein